MKKFTKAYRKIDTKSDLKYKNKSIKKLIKSANQTANNIFAYVLTLYVYPIINWILPGISINNR